MKALRFGWASLMRDSSPLAYKYGSSLGAVLIAGLFVFAVTVVRKAFQVDPPSN